MIAFGRTPDPMNVVTERSSNPGGSVPLSNCALLGSRIERLLTATPPSVTVMSSSTVYQSPRKMQATPLLPEAARVGVKLVKVGAIGAVRALFMSGSTTITFIHD